MATLTIKQLPLNPDAPLDGLASQETGVGTYNYENVATSTGAYVSQVVTPVTLTRASEAVTANTVDGDTLLAAIDVPAFGDIGLQVGRAHDNELSNSDFRSSTTGWTLTDSGGIVTVFAATDSDINESSEALRIRAVNGTGSAKTVEVHQSTSGGSISTNWVAQGLFKVSESVGSPIALIRLIDQTNANITTSPVSLTVDTIYRHEYVTQTLAAASTDLRWGIQLQLDDGETLDLKVTNVSLSESAWPVHYIPSTTGPTTRATDVVNVGSAGNAFYTHVVDTMWSIDVKTLGALTTIAGESQLQYIFSTYNGVNGTSLFVDDVNTITWRADFNSSFEDVTTTIAGDHPYRVYLRVLDDGGGGYDRQMFVENLTTGAISASSVLNTSNLPIQGDILKLGRDNSDANILDGFVGRLMYWDGDRSNTSMQRINSNWPS